jgi:hypothetical protein
VIQAISDADLAAADHILETFVVTGELPAGSAGSAASGDEATLEIINQTGDTLWYLYISPSSSDSWGEDWFGNEVLMAGETFVVTLEPGTYDLAAVNSEDVTVEEVYGMEISGSMSWTVTGN